MTVIDLPSKFIQTIISVHGKAGEKWLAGLDELIAYCKNKWQFELVPPKKLSYSFVAPVKFPDGGKAILKLCVPSTGINSEIAVLRSFNNVGYCRLIDTEPDKGIMLLEQIEPGTTLTHIKDEAIAVTIISDLIIEMHRSNPVVNYPFQTADDWYDDLLALQKRFGNNDFPESLFSNAVAAYQSVKSNPQQQRLLHGDLHQENILLSGNGKYKAIDPKGIIAETGCELIPFLTNIPLKRDISSIFDKCISIFSNKLEIDKERIIKWGAFRSVLSVYWKIEDNLPVTKDDIAMCRLFNETGI